MTAQLLFEYLEALFKSGKCPFEMLKIDSYRDYEIFSNYKRYVLTCHPSGHYGFYRNHRYLNDSEILTLALELSNIKEKK